MAVWVQLPELHVEYYENTALLNIDKGIGKPIKVDWHTSQAKRGRYARICIEVDTSITLPQTLQIGSRTQNISYEINSEFSIIVARLDTLEVSAKIIRNVN